MKTVILLQPKPSAKFSNRKLMVLEIFNKTRQKMGFDSLLKPSQNKKGQKFF